MPLVRVNVTHKGQADHDIPGTGDNRSSRGGGGVRPWGGQGTGGGGGGVRPGGGTARGGWGKGTGGFVSFLFDLCLERMIWLFSSQSQLILNGDTLLKMLMK